jgi:hypothetical protein
VIGGLAGTTLQDVVHAELAPGSPRWSRVRIRPRAAEGRGSPGPPIPRVAWLLIALLLAGASPTRAGTRAPLPEDESALEAGEIVIRGPQRAAGEAVVATVNIAAPPPVVLEEVMNLEARVAENRGLRTLEIYLRDSNPERIGAHWTASVFGFGFEYHVLYTCRRDEGTCTYRLDPDRPNDVQASEGDYVVVPHGSGSRLVFTSRTDIGSSVPGWLRRWIAQRALRRQMEGIRQRAEGRSGG